MDKKNITTSGLMDRNGKYYSKAEIALTKLIKRLEQQILQPFINRIAKLIKEDGKSIE